MNAPARERSQPHEVTRELVVVADDPTRAEALVRQLGLPDTPVFDALGVGEWALVPARTLVLWEIVPDRERLRRRIQIATANSQVVVVAGVEHPEVIELTLREGATILTWPGSDAALADSLRECLRGRVDKPRSRGVVLDSQRLADELHRALSRRLDQSSPSIQIAGVARMHGLIDRLATEILAESQAAPVAALGWDDMPTAVQTPEESGRFRTMAAAAARRGPSGSLTTRPASETQLHPATITTRLEPAPESPWRIHEHGYESIMETSQYPMLPPPSLPDLDEALPGAAAAVRDVGCDGAAPDADHIVGLEEPPRRGASSPRPAIESLRPSRPRRGLLLPVVALALASGVAAGVALFLSSRATPTAAGSVAISRLEPQLPGTLGAVPARAATTPATSVHTPADRVAPRSGEDQEAVNQSRPTQPIGVVPRRPTRAQRAQRAAARARGHLAHGRHAAALRAARVAHRLARGAPAYAALLAEVEAAAPTGADADTTPVEEAVARETRVEEASAVDAAAPETAAQSVEPPGTEADEPPTNPYRAGPSDRPTGQG